MVNRRAVKAITGGRGKMAWRKFAAKRCLWRQNSVYRYKYNNK
jgi:hypothetical protein